MAVKTDVANTKGGFREDVEKREAGFCGKWGSLGTPVDSKDVFAFGFPNDWATQRTPVAEGSLNDRKNQRNSVKMVKSC